MDADLSHDPKYLPDLVAAAGDHDVVLGSRYLNGISVVNWPLRRILLSSFANRYVRTITGLTTCDSTSGYRCWRRDALRDAARRAVHLSDGYAFMVETVFEVARHGRARRRGADHLRRAPRQGASKMSGPVLLESMLMPWRLVLAEPRAVRRPADGQVRDAPPRRRDAHDLVPAVSRRHDRHLHGAHRQGHRRARPRGPRGAAVAPAACAAGPGRGRRALPPVPLRAASAISTSSATPARSQADVRSARGRLGRRRRWRWPRPGARCAASRAQVGRHAAARPLDHPERRGGRPRPAAGCRSSSACTGRTCTWPSATPSRAVAAQAALRRLDWLTACSDDLRDRMIALGADPARAIDDSLRRRRAAVPARRGRCGREGAAAHGRRARTTWCCSPPGGSCARRDSST